MPFLMHPDGAVALVVHDENHRCRARLHRRAEFGAVHLEVAVAGKADDLSFGVNDLGHDRDGQSVAHRPGLRGRETMTGACDQLTCPPNLELPEAASKALAESLDGDRPGIPT